MSSKTFKCTDTNTSNRSVYFGVDVGSNKIVIGKSFSNKYSYLPVIETVGDTTDNRIIPNRIAMPIDASSARTFGNEVVVSKALNIVSDPLSAINRMYPLNIGGKIYHLPNCIAKNMIMSYVKTVMHMRIASDGSEDIKNIVYVPKYGHLDNMSLTRDDAFGIDFQILKQFLSAMSMP